MLNDEEISILALMRGLHFASSILKIPRESIIKIIINTNYHDFFEKIRKEITRIAILEGNQSAIEKFKIENQRLNQLKLFEKSLKPPKSLNPSPPSIITGITIKKPPKPVIIQNFSATTKEFFMHEAEKSSTRYSICDTFHIDRDDLKTWSRSYHRTGLIKSSKKKHIKASAILEKAYDQLKSE